MPSDIIEYVRREQRNGGYFSLYTISPEDHIMIGWDAMLSFSLDKCTPPPETTPPREPGAHDGEDESDSRQCRLNNIVDNADYYCHEASYMSTVYQQQDLYLPEFYIPRTLVPVRPGFEAFHDLVPIDPWVYDGEFSAVQALWHGAVWDDTCGRQQLEGVPWAPLPVDGARSRDPLQGMDPLEREKCAKQAEEETDALLRAAIQHAWYDLEQGEEKFVGKPTPRDQSSRNASNKSPRASSPEIGG